MNLNELGDADLFQQHFVMPVIAALESKLEAQLTPLVTRVVALEDMKLGDRVTTIEGYTKKLATLYTGIITAATFLAHYAWTKVKAKVFPGT